MNKLYHTVAVIANNESILHNTNSIAFVSGLYYVVCIAVQTASALKQIQTHKRLKKVEGHLIKYCIVLLNLLFNCTVLCKRSGLLRDGAS